LDKQFTAIDPGIGIKKTVSNEIKDMAKNWTVLRKIQRGMGKVCYKKK
jgi:hypothetical protein